MSIMNDMISYQNILILLAKNNGSTVCIETSQPEDFELNFQMYAIKNSAFVWSRVEPHKVFFTKIISRDGKMDMSNLINKTHEEISNCYLWQKIIK